MWFSSLYGASLLDRLLKEIISESKDVNVSNFIPILKQYILLNNPYIRRLAVSWISVDSQLQYYF